MSNRVVVTNTTAPRRAELRWRSVKIRKSLDDICHTMELELPSSERGRVRKHDRIQVHVANPLITDHGGRRLVATIMVDEVTASADASNCNVAVLGRSPARDIVDSTWSDTSWPADGGGATLTDLVRMVGRRLGWDDEMVHAFPEGNPPRDPTEQVGFFRWDIESPWAKLLTEADGQGFMITSSAAGGLFIWRPSRTLRNEGFRIEEGAGVRSVEIRENGAEQFHEYVVVGNFKKAVIRDDTCRNRRVLTIDVTREGVHPNQLARRAETEMLRRREVRTAVTVSGWGLPDPQIRMLGDTARREIVWSPNFLVEASVPSMGVSENLLVADVEHEADALSMRSTVTLVRREMVTGRAVLMEIME